MALHHVAHEAERDDDRDREEGGERLAAETLADVVGRAAGQVAVSVAGAVELGKDGFGEDGRHAEEGGDPHPEDGARTAHGDGGGHAGEVAVPTWAEMAVASDWKEDMPSLSALRPKSVMPPKTCLAAMTKRLI